MKKIIFLILLTLLSVHFETSTAFVINQDTITLNGIPTGESAYILVDGPKNDRCKNDQMFTVNNNSPKSIGDFAANNDSCRNEIFVFSKGKMAMCSTKNWRGNQNLTFGLSDYKTVNVKFWIPSGNNLDGISWGEMVQTYKARANVLFDDFRFGLQITSSFISSDSMAAYQSLLSSGYASCCSGLFETLKDNSFYTEGIINVYLVDRIPDGGDARGYNCSRNQNVIFLNKTNLTVETLAHEIGHAFSLGHSETMRGFTRLNIMNGNRVIRDKFHLGQSFHANFNSKSIFKNYLTGTRISWFRPCSGADDSPNKCPKQAFNF